MLKYAALCVFLYPISKHVNKKLLAISGSVNFKEVKYVHSLH